MKSKTQKFSKSDEVSEQIISILDEYIKPAREGTLRVLKSAQKAKVKKVILTSSIVAMMGKVLDSDEDTGTIDSESWTDENSSNINTYMKSKTLAAKAA